jgi:hypothetical protein
MPGFITNRETDHPDADQCSFLQNVRRYVSANTFVTRAIFNDYLGSILSLDIGDNAKAVLIFDGYRAHLSDVLNAWIAENQILLSLLPPHSSHLVQPLDQGFSRRLKVEYSLFATITILSKRSSSLDRIWMLIQATIIARLVWNTGSHTGSVCKSPFFLFQRPSRSTDVKILLLVFSHLKKGAA